MGQFTGSDKVRPMSFHKIDEDGSATNLSRRKLKKNHMHDEQIQTEVDGSHKTNLNLPPNFSFEHNYPAVIFDKVCFSVDRSQQQANFFYQCTHRLKSCLGSNHAIKESKQVDILKSIDLNVPYGSIFGLLGPSSCGKTTLLRCLVGLLRPNSGSIRLFCQSSEVYGDEFEEKTGCCKQARSKRSVRSSKWNVPGSNVGYMPQDLGLYEDFSIRQLLTMFGQYMTMGSALIKSRIEFMAQFLDLPEVDRQIGSLSGGQKRRVSFAIACLHMPPLIILDEPTVGVDPLLRQSIWKYLRRLADEENKTIIITTHYIEEAAQADQVALMRAGEILVQDTPKRIMEANGCKSLEEAFLKICNNVRQDNAAQRYKLYPQPRFNWHDQLNLDSDISSASKIKAVSQIENHDLMLRELKLKAEEKLILFDSLLSSRSAIKPCLQQHNVKLDAQKLNKLSMVPNISETVISKQPQHQAGLSSSWHKLDFAKMNNRSITTLLKGNKLVINGGYMDRPSNGDSFEDIRIHANLPKKRSLYDKVNKCLTLIWALLYKNYRRNVNSLPLLAFQFMLPIIQMISFSLCVGGRPSNIGLGLVNLDQPVTVVRSELLNSLPATMLSGVNNNNTSYIFNSTLTNSSLGRDDNGTTSDTILIEESLSERYLSFVDETIISIRPYNNIEDALADVRRAKIWAAMEIGENFTSAISQRFDLDNFYQLDYGIIQQSVIKLYPDRSNKVLDMICQRSLFNSYRKFLMDQFDHFKQLPIEVKEPIFDIKPNLISNSIDGYTESIAAGLLASLTYIMAAGLTTFIMVVERSAGILERTFTSGINPVAYLLAHAVFRSVVMMIQIAVVMFLTFYILRQPLVGSIWLAYLMLMTLNLTGIAYGLVISSLVTDQNGAALTIVSSLVVKITMSGILWPFEAIPRWLRTICYIQPLTMPVQALKTITLKGNGLEDRSVQMGFFVSIFWLVVFLTLSARRFKFYQH